MAQLKREIIMLLEVNQQKLEKFVLKFKRFTRAAKKINSKGF